MQQHTRRTVLVLLSIAILILCSGLFLRSMIGKDFTTYVAGERMALVRLVSSNIGAAYDDVRGWNRGKAVDAILQTRILGLEVKVVNSKGEFVMDTDTALALQSPERRGQVLAAAGSIRNSAGADTQSYPLLIEGKKAGALDVTFLRAEADDSIMKRSGTMVLAWSCLLSGLVVVLTIFLSRQPAARVEKNEQTTETSSVIDTHNDISIPEMIETADLHELPTHEPEASVAAVVEEKPLEPEPDDPMDTDDEDMQPLAGDPDRVTRIVKGLDELAKAEAFRGALRKQPIELASYLGNIIEKTRASVPDKDVTFNLECDRDLKLSADPACLEGIVSHLLTNARKAVKNSGTVTVSAAKDNDAVVLTVNDTGVGISRKVLPHIYERFYRGSGSGIGLGLTIVKELVEACEGTIDVQSTRGKGSQFMVVIPLS